MASVLSQASGRSANSARMSAAGLNQCSGVTRRRSRSDSRRPSAMHSSASCASCIVGRGEVAVVGGDQRNAAGVGERDQARLDRTFHRQAMAMQFHDGTIGERLGQRAPAAVRPPASGPPRAGARAARWCRRSAGSGPRHAPRSASKRKLRLQRRIGVQKAARRQPLQIGQPRRRSAPAARSGRAAGADCRRGPARSGSR